MCGYMSRASSTSTSMITQDGHGVNLRKVLEAEIGNNEQGEPTKKARVKQPARKVAPRAGITETRHTASEFGVLHFCIFGNGEGWDPTQCFCTHCKCRVHQRHTLFQLVRLPSGSTVGDIAKAHRDGIKVQTLWRQIHCRMPGSTRQVSCLRRRPRS